MPSINQSGFLEAVNSARGESNALSDAHRVVIPVAIRVLADQLTPVLAYRRLVSSDQRTAPSFLLESVEGGDQQGRYSILAAHPKLELVAKDSQITVTDHHADDSTTTNEPDPLDALRKLSEHWSLTVPQESTDRNLLPKCILGGWFGYAGYDSVRYAEPTKLSLDHAPPDDRNLPDLSFGFYDEVVVFDHVDKLIHLVKLVFVGINDDPATQYAQALESLDRLAAQVQEHSKPLSLGRVVSTQPTKNAAMPCNTTREEHAQMVDKAKEYIRQGDIFQVVLGHRFERRANADPFDVYRALRAVNPSPYMVYMQTRGSILVASSPEILCRVRRDESQSDHDTTRFIVTNRPLAGTRRRGKTPEDDLAMEHDLLADPKEISEHSMLVDLGRNDVGIVAEPGSIELSQLMCIERYSHVMHISSTVTGIIRDGLDCWDALRAALPVGTISGAPKIRAMQIIDELEKVRRGPYGGGLGWVSLDQEMDIALTLRTMVVPLDRYDETSPDGRWEYHIQAAGGIVADSVPDLEFKETVNKAAALGAAIDLAISAFD